MRELPENQPPGPAGWRPKLALFLFILALVSPAIVPLVLATDLPREVRGAVAGLLLFGLPMALMLAVIALLGRRAYVFIKRHRIAGHDASSEVVGLTRHRVGLVLLALAVLTSWLEPVLSPHFPALAARKVLVGTLADGMLLISLFVLGGEFWDKVHALFVHDARVVSASPVSAAAAAEAVQVGLRFYLGAAIFVAAFAAWLLVPAASAAGWSTAQIASLTGAVFVSNKVGLLTAIAVMGKPGFNHLKGLLLGLFRKLGPPQQVSRNRYRLGLVLFLVPVLMTWVAPYAPVVFGTTGVYGFLQNRALEALLVVGLFLLGGDFWDKLGALFKRRAKVEFGPRAALAFS